MIGLGDSRWNTLISCIDEWIIQKNWKKAIEIGLKAKTHFPNKYITASSKQKIILFT